MQETPVDRPTQLERYASSAADDRQGLARMSLVAVVDPSSRSGAGYGVAVLRNCQFLAAAHHVRQRLAPERPISYLPTARRLKVPAYCSSVVTARPPRRRQHHAREGSCRAHGPQLYRDGNARPRGLLLTMLATAVSGFLQRYCLAAVAPGSRSPFPAEACRQRTAYGPRAHHRRGSRLRPCAVRSGWPSDARGETPSRRSSRRRGRAPRTGGRRAAVAPARD